MKQIFLTPEIINAGYETLKDWMIGADLGMIATVSWISDENL